MWFDAQEGNMFKGMCGHSRRSRLEINVREVNPRKEACHFMRDEMHVGQSMIPLSGEGRF